LVDFGWPAAAEDRRSDQVKRSAATTRGEGRGSGAGRGGTGRDGEEERMWMRVERLVTRGEQVSR
jgi:ribosomal protein L15